MTVTDYWHKQTEEPLFPDLLWSQPENKQQAGKLLIIGGNLHGFAAPAEAYQAAVKAGIGVAKVLLPDALKKVVGPIIENGEYAPSTPSGSFSQKALGEFLEFSGWADGVLLAGDLGRNSETAILIEKCLAKIPHQITLTKDAADYAINTPLTIAKRDKTCLVISVEQLQRFAKNILPAQPIKFSMDLLQLVEVLHEITSHWSGSIVTQHSQTIFVAHGGQVSTTPLTSKQDIWRVQTATYCAVWWLQNPAKPFEALTTAATLMAGRQTHHD